MCIRDRVKWLAAGSLVLAAASAAPLFTPRWSWLTGLGTGLVAWITLTTIKTFIEHKNKQKTLSFWQDFTGRSRSFYGMLTAHLGMAMLILGVTYVSIYDMEKDVSIRPGETYSLNDYSFRFEDIRELSGPNYTSYMAEFELYKNNTLIGTLSPEKRVYNIQTMPMTEASVNTGLMRDVYVSLGEPLGDNAWAVRLYYKPMVRWIWLGSIFMAIGGLLAVTDRRYRQKVRGTSSSNEALSSPAS